MDRTNIAMAVPGIRAELGLTTAQIGFATGCFFWGYIILQIPVGRIATLWSAKQVIGILVVLWSVVSMTTALVQTEWQLILNRLVLGLTEGGVLTAVMVLNRAWFSRGERAKAVTLFLSSIAVAPAIANPIAGVVLSYVDWRWMFVVEGLPGLLWAAVWWWAVADSPAKARWLPEAERGRIQASLEAEPVAVPIQGHWSRTLVQPSVLLLTLYNFFALAAEYSVIFWMPSVLQDTGLAIGAIGFLSAVPYLAGTVAMVVVGLNSDRFQERKWHMIACTVLSGLFLVLGQVSVAGPWQAWYILALLTLSNAVFFSRYGPFWALPAEVLPVSVFGVGIVLINGAGNLGGFFGPFLAGYLRDQTGSFSVALALAGVALIGSGLVALPLRIVNARPRGDVVAESAAPARANLPERHS